LARTLAALAARHADASPEFVVLCGMVSPAAFDAASRATSAGGRTPRPTGAARLGSVIGRHLGTGHWNASYT